jgi:Holliday junction resolvasome RuvABC endonuclease subunit
MGQAFGVTVGVFEAASRRLRYVQAHDVKQSVGGLASASKAEVADGVFRLTGWRSTAATIPAREAEADAAAVALTLRDELVGGVRLGRLNLGRLRKEDA